MENFALALTSVFPLFVYMMIGVMIKRIGLFEEHDFKKLNSLMFHIFLPMKLISDIIEVDIYEVFIPTFYLFTFTSILIVFVLSYFFFRSRFDDWKTGSTLLQGVFRSNFLLFGGVIAESLTGGSVKGVLSGLTAFVTPLFNVLAIIAFMKNGKKKVGFLQVTKELISNPLILAGLIGLLLSLLDISFPSIIMGPFRTVGNLASPLALIALGGFLSFKSIKAHMWQLMMVVAGRLVIVPAIILFPAVFMGYRGVLMATLLAIFASPAAVSSAPMAQVMGGDEILAGEIVAATSIFAIVSLFLWISLLSSFGVFQ